jgi:enterochelin esterase-like enzyme
MRTGLNRQYAIGYSLLLDFGLAAMLYRMTGLIRRWAFALALLAALSACLPFNRPAPTELSPGKTPTLMPTPVTSPSLTPDNIPTKNTPTPSPPACLSAPGQILNGIIDGTLLAKAMTYHVYVPPCYLDEPEMHYPTLYLLLGQTYHEDQWIRLGVPAAMDKLIAAGVIPPFVIVFPYDYSYLQPTQYRFEDVFMQALIPQIDTTYRTIPNTAHRAVGGLSRGAAWALHLGIRHPEIFGAIGAHSPVIFYSDGTSLPVALQAIPSGQLPRLYIDIGDADEDLENDLNFKSFLDEHNIPYEWHANIGFHDEAYWAAHVEAYLQWYAEGWMKK